MRLRFSIPEGRFCRWLSRRVNPRHLVTKLPFGVRVLVFFLAIRKDDGMRTTGARIWICR